MDKPDWGWHGGDPRLFYKEGQVCRCIVSLSALRRDTYWFSTVDLDLRRYWSVISDIRLYSRIQNTSVLFPIGGRTTIPSGLILQNLSFTTVSLGCPSRTLLDSSHEGVIHLSGCVCSWQHSSIFTQPCVRETSISRFNSIMVNKLAYKPSVRDKDIMDKYYEMFRDKNGTKKKMCVLLQRGKYF